jgi:hypothetical protein
VVSYHCYDCSIFIDLSIVAWNCAACFQNGREINKGKGKGPKTQNIVESGSSRKENSLLRKKQRMNGSK